VPSTTDALRRSPLDDRHRAAGAKLIEFAGWEMPLQYEGIRAEHEAVRTRAGVFDVSHMGQIETTGPGAQALLQYLLSNDLRRLPEGGAQYSVICTPEGGVTDDVFTYRLAECVFLTVTNAANHERDLEWFRRHAPDFDADVIDRRDAFAMLALQGPRARQMVASLADGPLVPRMHCGGRTVADVPLLMCGTGYTGEPGVELMMDPEQAGEVWDALIAAGAAPVGLGARDTLRLEVCYHLHGNDLDRDHGPIEAGLGWCCREATGFVGSDSVARVRAEGPAEKLVAFEMTGGGIARQGNPIAGGGVVTSGTFSPSLQRGIGMAYVPTDRSEPGTELEIDVRGTPRAAVIRSKPLYTPKES
jgi:glycine cleavage system T protein (aminomethyltransferase)